MTQRSASDKVKASEMKDMIEPLYLKIRKLGVSICTSAKLSQSIMQNCLKWRLEILTLVNLGQESMVKLSRRGQFEMWLQSHSSAMEEALLIFKDLRFLQEATFISHGTNGTSITIEWKLSLL